MWPTEKALSQDELDCENSGVIMNASSKRDTDSDWNCVGPADVIELSSLEGDSYSLSDASVSETDVEDGAPRRAPFPKFESAWAPRTWVSVVSCPIARSWCCGTKASSNGDFSPSTLGGGTNASSSSVSSLRVASCARHACCSSDDSSTGCGVLSAACSSGGERAAPASG
eukprot:scaffold144575_cov33-Tisochrysis_lutea.AAC.1